MRGTQTHKQQVYLITLNGGGYIVCDTLQCPSMILNISGRYARDTDTGPWHITVKGGIFEIIFVHLIHHLANFILCLA